MVRLLDLQPANPSSIPGRNVSHFFFLFLLEIVTFFFFLFISKSNDIATETNNSY